jgi:hypothetical protein
VNVVLCLFSEMLKNIIVRGHIFFSLIILVGSLIIS